MSDRREFLKQAGSIAMGGFSGISVPPRMANAIEASAANDEPAGAVVIENAEMRLVISATGMPQSLVHKATGQECLRQDDTVSMFTLTQDMPYDNEVQAIYPGKIKHFRADRVSRDNDR